MIFYLRDAGSIMTRIKITLSVQLFIGLTICVGLLSSQAVAGIAPTLTEEGSSPVWNILISILVIAISGSIAALPIAALKQWRGVWKKLAMLPLAIIIVWMVVIALSKLINPDSHSLWTLEVFSWAMITSVYMVILITAKRAFEKEDSKEGTDI
jgi:hypothetical protein